MVHLKVHTRMLAEDGFAIARRECSRLALIAFDASLKKLGPGPS
jgi:hypothetical protein